MEFFSLRCLMLYLTVVWRLCAACQDPDEETLHEQWIKHTRENSRDYQHESMYTMEANR